MAREKGDGIWHSKLGGCQDIRHYGLEGVEDYCDYGRAKYFMRKRIPGVSRWQIRKRLTRILSGLKRKLETYSPPQMQKFANEQSFALATQFQIDEGFGLGGAKV